MTAQELIDTVHEIDALEAAETKAREESAVRRGKIVALRARLEQASKNGAGKSLPPGATALGALGAAIGAAIVAGAAKRRESPRQDAIRKLLMRKPDATYKDVVRELYGEYNEPNVLNARSLVSNMKRAGLLAGEPGAWRVTGDLGAGKGAPAVPMSPLARAARGDDDEEEHAA